MAKLWTYVFITVGLMALLSIAGLQTTANVIFTNPQDFINFKSGAFWGALLAAITVLATVVGVALTFFGRQASTIPVSAGIALAILLTFVGDIVSIVTLAPEGWARTLLFVILAPFVAGYALALYEWVIGKD